MSKNQFIITLIVSILALIVGLGNLIVAILDLRLKQRKSKGDRANSEHEKTKRNWYKPAVVSLCFISIGIASGIYLVFNHKSLDTNEQTHPIGNSTKNESNDSSSLIICPHLPISDSIRNEWNDSIKNTGSNEIKEGEMKDEEFWEKLEEELNKNVKY
jgi:hypothetical protein